MYNPKELQKKAQLNVSGVDNNAQTSLVGNAPESEENAVVRHLATVGDVATNVLQGATKTLEGLFDAGAMLVGIFGADVDDLVKYDFTSDLFGRDGKEGIFNTTWGEDLSNASYLTQDNAVNQIAQGVGGMLPAIAINFVPVVGQALSGVMFAGGAGGNASEQALNEGNNYWQSLGYGALRGGIEGATEMLGGRVFGSTTKTGNTFLGKVLNADKWASKGLGKAVYNFTSEGLEEVLADVLDIPTRDILGMSNEENYNKTFKDYLGTFAVGGTVGTLLDGFQKGGSALFNHSKGGRKYVQVAEDMREIADDNKVLASLQANPKVTQEQLDKATVKIAKRDIGFLEDMSKEFQSMTESQRTEAFNTLEKDAPMVVDMFESNGALKQSVIDSYNEVVNGKGAYNVSSDLIGNTKDIQSTLDEINESGNKKDKDNGWDLQISNTKYEGAERENYAKVSKAIQGLGKKSGTKLNLVMIKDDNRKANAFIKGNYVFVTDAQLKDGKWAKAVAHEVTHFTEKSKDYFNFGDFTLNDKDARAYAISEMLKKPQYKVSSEEIKTLFDKLSKDEEITSKELMIYQELVAHATENILGNEAVINKLARDNEGWARKILNKIKDFLDAVKGTNADKDTVAKLTKAQELFDKALKSAGTVQNIKTAIETNKKAELRNAKANDSEETKYSLKSLDDKYLELAKNPELNEAELKRIIEEYSKLQGYSTDSDYQGTSAFNGKAPSSNAFFETKESRIKAWENDEFEDTQTLGDYIKDGIDINNLDFIALDERSYRSASPERKEAILNIRKAIQLGSKFIKMYRSVPISVKETKFRNGDWITPSKSYAVENAEIHGWGNDYKIIEQSVSVEHIWWDGNDIAEWGFDDGNNYAYKNTPNNAKLFNVVTYDDNGDIIPLSKRFNDSVSDVRFSYSESKDTELQENKKITIGMSDSERYEILKDKEIKLSAIADDSKLESAIQNIKNRGENTVYIGVKSNERVKVFKKIGDEFGIFKEYSNENINLLFTYSKGSINESLDNQKKNYQLFAKMITCFDKVVENAIGIEVHNKNVDEYKKDTTLKQVYVLASAFKDGNNIVPVKLEVKEFIDKKNTLYVAIALESIKIDDFAEQGNTKNGVTQYPPSPTISIKELFKNVNTLDENFLKYIPNEFLTDKQKTAKDGIKTKDSQGNVLTRKQQEFFKDSKVRDENGNLIPMYHGTFEKFTVFDISKTNSANNLGKGHYFTSSIEDALNHYTKAGQNEDSWNDTNNKIESMVADLLSEKGYDYGDSLPNDAEVTEIFNEAYKQAEEYYSENNSTLMSVYLNIKNPIFVKKGKEVGSVLSRVFVDNNNKIVKINEDDILKSEYDGIIDTTVSESFNGVPKGSIHAVAFDSNQIKLTTNKHPTDNPDIRFSYTSRENTFDLIEEKPMSQGQVAKTIANYSREKVFSKSEAEFVLNDIIQSIDIEGKTVDLTGKSYDEAVNAIWISWNSQDVKDRVKTAYKIADYIIEQSVAEDIYFDEENKPYIETIETIKPYFHSMDLSGLKGQIKATTENNSLYALWSAGKNKGMTADQIAMELTDMGYPIDTSSEWGAFEEINNRYQEARDFLNRKRKETVSKLYTKDQLSDLKLDIVNQIVESYNKKGKESKFIEITTYNKNANRLIYELEKLEKVKEFKNATQYENDKMFAKNILSLKSIKWRGNITESARHIVGNVATWYNEKNPILRDKYVQDVKNILESIAQGQGKLTATEVKDLADVVFVFRKLITDFYKVYRNGKYEDALPVSERYVGVANDRQDIKVSLGPQLFRKTDNAYFNLFADPASIMRWEDGYQNGFNTEMFEEFRNASVNAEVLLMDLMKPVEAFYKANKKYEKTIRKEKVVYQGEKISKDMALYLYMALNDKDAILGVAESGISWYDKDGYLENRVAGFNNNPDATTEEIEEQAKQVQENLKKQFNEKDLEFIKIAEKLFNEDCKRLKIERDLQRLGYSNVKDGYYCPIRRAWIYHSSDSNTVNYEMDRVSNKSFNKERVKNAKNELVVEPLSVVLNRHLKGIAQYYAMSNAIDNFNVLYNLDIGNNPNNVHSVKTAMAKTWGKQGEEYWKKLITDIQGIKGAKEGVFSFIRGSYAKFQLGANPKVWITQLSSFFASTNILDYSSVVKGWFVDTKDVDKYCRLAELRNHDNTVALAEGVLDKVSGVGDILTKPIGKFDRLVIRGLWGACQVQIAKKGKGYEIGTEQNKVEAGKLLQKVILETQQNSLATERSQAMRSENELLKTFTMFSSDAMKVLGRFVDSTLKIKVLKARRKVAKSQAEIDAINSELKSARKQVARSTSALVLSSMFMMAVAQAFKWLLDQDEEDENVIENMAIDFFGNLLGGLPLWKNLYAKVFEGYDVEVPTLQTLNDVFGAVETIGNLAVDIWNRKATTQDVTKATKDFSFAVGQFTGIPTRNILKYFTGLSKRIVPEFGYQVESLFYNQNISKDLSSAIKKQDKEMVETITSVVLGERMGQFNDNTREEISRLMGIDLDGNGKGDYDVIPTAVGDTITVNGVQYDLDGTKYKQFKDIYTQAIPEVEKLVASAKYQKLSDKAKAKAINTLYNYYYYQAQAEVLEIEQDKKLYLFGEIVPIDQLTYAIGYASEIKDNKNITNKKAVIQKYVQSLKLTANNKLLVMAYLGYKNSDKENLIKSIINRSNLTKNQKTAFIQACGY